MVFWAAFLLAAVSLAAFGIPMLRRWFQEMEALEAQRAKEEWRRAEARAERAAREYRLSLPYDLSPFGFEFYYELGTGRRFSTEGIHDTWGTPTEERPRFAFSEKVIDGGWMPNPRPVMDVAATADMRS